MPTRRFWYACVVVIYVATLAFAQNYGSIGGSVKDASGGVIPAATVSVTNTETGVVNRVTSLADGKYLFTSLQPGSYEVSGEMQGFKKSTNPGISLHVSDKLTLDITLEVGASAETVTVTGEAPVLRVADVQGGEIVDNNFISKMPQLNRDPFALVALSGNVSGSGSSLTLTGGRTSAVDYYVDGGVINTGQSNRRANVSPSMDAVAEFKVVNSGISAEYGRISGGYVTLITKSGTNSYHGSMYEYMYNDMFNANSWQQNAIGAKKAHFRQNDFGFTLGGPVTIPKVYSGRNKTFFFVDNEYLKKTVAGKVTLSGFPTDLERSGDFTQTLYGFNYYTIYDPFGPQVFNTTKGLWERTGLLGGDGKHVPANLISETSKKVLAMAPKGNRAAMSGSSSTNNYQWGSSSKLNNFRFGVRIDHNISDTQRLNIRYQTFSSDEGAAPIVDSPMWLSTVNESDGGVNANVNYTWSMAPTTVLEVRSSVLHNPSFAGAVNGDGLNSQAIFPKDYWPYLASKDWMRVYCQFQGGTGFGLSASKNLVNSTTYNFASTITKVRASHTIKFGGETRRYYDNFLAGGGTNETRFLQNPVFQFQGDWGGAVQGQILSLAAMELGINSRSQVFAPTTRNMNTNYIGFFVQDDWKVTSKITLNLGLRYDNERPTTERHDKLYFWDPTYPSLFKINPGYDFVAAVTAAGYPDAPIPSWWKNKAFDPGAVLIANTPAFPSRTPQIVSNTQFAPRIGMAYQASTKTVIRMAAGKMYLPSTGNANSYSSSGSNVALSNQVATGWHPSLDGGRNYISTWEHPFPLPSMFTNYSRDIMTTNLASALDPGVNVVTRTLHMPREYSWSIDMQRELPFNLVVQVGYSGNRGLGLLANDSISHYPKELFIPKYASMMQMQAASPNAGQTNETTITGKTQQIGLMEYQYPYYGKVQIIGVNEGRSIYHSGTFRIERRFSNGISVLANYTRSRLMDDVGGADGQGSKEVQGVDSFHSVWGLSMMDRPNKFNLAATFEFPFGKGKKFLSSPAGIAAKLLDGVVGGWTLAGNYSRMSGTPITLTGGTGRLVTNTIKVATTFPSYASSDHNLVNPKFTDYTQILYGPNQAIVPGFTGYLDPTKIVNSQMFVLGDIPPNDSRYRNPGFSQVDLSFMKNFRFQETRYVQIRAEAQNAFNIRGFGSIQAQVGSPTYGLITTAGNTERQIQLSARINF